MMNTENIQAPSTRELLTFYYRNRSKLLLAFFVPFILAVALSYVPVPRYKATSVLTVRMGSEYIYQPEVGSSQNTTQTTIPLDRDQIFKAEVAILSSHDLHEKVIKQIGVNVLYPNSVVEGASQEDGRVALAKAVTRFEKRFDVNLEKESSVITVSFEDKSAGTAIKVLDTLLNQYMEKRKELYLESRAELAKTHAEEAHQRALAAGKAIEDFKVTHQIHSFDDERRALVDQRSEVEKQRTNIRSPELDKKLAYLDAKLDRLNKDEAEFNILNHDATVAQDEYSVFSHRLSEATAYEDIERERTGSVRVIQPPTAPAEPKSMQIVIIAAGFVLSLLAFILMAIIIDMLGSGFSTPEQMEKAIGLPVLSVLPRRK